MWPCCGMGRSTGELAEVDHGPLALLVSLRLFQDEGEVLGMPLNVAESCMWLWSKCFVGWSRVFTDPQ